MKAEKNITIIGYLEGNQRKMKNRLYNIVKKVKDIKGFQAKSKFLKSKKLFIRNEFIAFFSIGGVGYKLHVSIFEHAPVSIYLEENGSFKTINLRNKIFHQKINSNQF